MTYHKGMAKKTKLPEMELDPIFPIQAGTGIDRTLKPGQGAEILANDSINAETGLTYRAFWHIWENVEVTAARMYPRYVGQNKDVANTWLEAVLWCRNIAHRAAHFGEGEIFRITEEEAEKIRQAQNPKRGKVSSTGERKCPKKKCGGTDIMKSRRAGIPGFKCRSCNFWWPSEVPTSPGEASEEAVESTELRKKKDKAQKGEKKSKKGKGKKKSRSK